MKLLSKNDIKKVFTMKDAIEADKLAFKLNSLNKCEAPLRSNIQAPKVDGSFLVMPAYIEDLDMASVKMINLFPHNIDNGLPSSPGQVLLMDGTTGMFKALLDGTYVTQLRTGAASGAAFDILACKDAKIGCLIGTGGQAATQLEAMLACRELNLVKVFDLNLERTQNFVLSMQEELKDYGVEIIAVDSSDKAIEDADIIVTVTPSTKPVFDGNKVKKGATISCVGSYQHHMQEMDPIILKRASKIYFDSEQMVLAESGDIIIPLEKGLITKDDFTGDLGDVILENIVGRESDDEIIVFKTVGVAAQDLITAKIIYEKAVAANVGIDWQ